MAKYRILLADSNNQFQTTVRDYLTAQEGIERVDTVNDGQSALDAMNNNRYDVLLCGHTHVPHLEDRCAPVRSHHAGHGRL